jgi:ferredoxin
MYVLLTTKPGLFRTEAGPEVELVESYDYLFFGRKRARFDIARIDAPTRIRIVDETPPVAINLVPTKFLPTFASVEAARAELEGLVASGGADTQLVRLHAPVAAKQDATQEDATIVFLTGGGKVVKAAAQSNLLRVSLREQGGIPFKCGGGLCGTCHCTIESGLEHTDAVKAKERKLLTEEELRQGHRLACQTFLTGGEVRVSWVPLAQRAARTPVPR